VFIPKAVPKFLPLAAVGQFLSLLLKEIQALFYLLVDVFDAVGFLASKKRFIK